MTEELGSLILDTEWGDLYVGTGFDAQQRKDLWDNYYSIVGKKVTFKHSPVIKDKPRFPVFKCFRED